jgi:D-cysteine desulfhydrase/L-cysteate sulfo-lyase
VAVDGNLLLDNLLGAEVHILEPGENSGTIAEELATKERAAGNTPYVVPVGGSRLGGSMQEPLGAMGYITAFLETHQQLRLQGMEADYVVMATGSGGTQAGLVVGAAAVGAKTKIVGISVSGSAEAIKENVANIATQTAASLDLDLAFEPDDIIVFDDYVGEGYGKLTQGTVDAIEMAAQQEGILLDPVYTGKAMSGLVGLIEEGFFQDDDLVVFIHTGGTPGIFHYGDDLLKWIKG